MIYNFFGVNYNDRGVTSIKILSIYVKNVAVYNKKFYRIGPCFNMPLPHLHRHSMEGILTDWEGTIQLTSMSKLVKNKTLLY